MSMTEKEAKTKWCPMAREALQSRDVNTLIRRDNGPSPVVVANRFPSAGVSYCLASGCAVWVWDDRSYKGDPFHGMGADGWADNPEAADRFREQEIESKKRTHGHCGLIRSGQ